MEIILLKLTEIAGLSQNLTAIFIRINLFQVKTLASVVLLKIKARYPSALKLGTWGMHITPPFQPEITTF
jgi:hypothetical protein